MKILGVKWLPVLIMILSLFVPGHIRLHWGWMAGLVVYTLIYFLLGYLYRFSRLRTGIYLSLTVLFFFFVPLYTYFDFPDFWYPHIMPIFMLCAVAGFACGILFAYGKYIPAILNAVVILGLQLLLYFNISSFVYDTYINPPRLKYLVGITPRLSFVDLHNDSINESVLKGKVVILDFWFTGCGICIKKMPAYDSLYAHYKSRTDIVFLSVVDGSVNTVGEIRRFLTKKKIDCPVAYDPGGTMVHKYHISSDGYPIELRIDKKGQVQEVIAGFPDAGLYYDHSIFDINHLLEINE